MSIEGRSDINCLPCPMFNSWLGTRTLVTSLSLWMNFGVMLPTICSYSSFAKKLKRMLGPNTIAARRRTSQWSVLIMPARFSLASCIDSFALRLKPSRCSICAIRPVSRRQENMEASVLNRFFSFPRLRSNARSFGRSRFARRDSAMKRNEQEWDR